MDNASMTTNLFERKYEEIEKVIPFNPEWKNSTGYFDGAVEGSSMVQLEPGEEAKSYEEASDRKMIFIGTFLGPIVIFARYRAAQNGIYVHNSASLLRSSGVISTSQLGYDNLNFVFTGGHTGQPYNIEGYLRHLKEVLTYQEQPKATTEQITQLVTVFQFIIKKAEELKTQVSEEDLPKLSEILTQVLETASRPNLGEHLSQKTQAQMERTLSYNRNLLEQLRQMTLKK